MNVTRRIDHLRELIAREKQALPYAEGSAYTNTQSTINAMSEELRELEELVSCREAHEDVQRLTRELDVLLNGKDRAAPQASLCDLVAQTRKTAELLGLEDAVLVDLDRKNVLLDCANEVIRTCVEDFVGDDAAAMSFLETWSNADWDQLRAEFPEANDLVYAADPSWEGWNR